MKVLISEDEAVARILLANCLKKWGYHVVVTDDGKQAWEELQKPDAPHLVISDWMMPHMDGIELCRKVRERVEGAYTYFIMLTTKESRKSIIKGLEAGADDFMVKPFDQEELRVRMRIGERILDLEHRILQLARTDALTGVLNRRAFMEKLALERERAGREKTPFSFIITDIDSFKRVNDTYGHQAGDAVLQKFSQALVTGTRPYDFVGRYGGEEFVICLPGASEKQALIVSERIREQVEGMRITTPDNSGSIQITTSFGVASFDLSSEESIDSLVKRADDALYRAKSEGKNRACLASESIPVHAGSPGAIENRPAAG